MNDDFNYSDERFADIQMLRYRLRGFDELSLQQKKYVYYLSKATLAGRNITTDQFGKYNLKVRKVFEVLYEHYSGDRNDENFIQLELYLKRIWFSNGIHHHYGSNKFIPGFSEDFFKKALFDVDTNLLPLNENQTKEDLMDELLKVIFDSQFLAKRVNKAEDEDLIQTSACNFYEGVTQIEVEDFYNNLKKSLGEEPVSIGLNTKLVKENNQLKEVKWIASGLYGKYIQKIIYWLELAKGEAENSQQKYILDLLIEYYRTGDLKVFDKYSIEWLKEQEGKIDFINGFVEVYGDPLGLKGSWEGLVEYKDDDATKRTQTISSHAQWFEDHSPVDQRFKKSRVIGVSAHAVCAAMLGGDEYPASAIGINLPNSEWIRARYGSKSVTIGNLTEAYRVAAQDNGFLEEFVIDGETLQIVKKYSDICDDLHTSLHECVGHGSGQLLPGVDSDSLKAYGDTIEEARADLFGLYYIADNKMVELGLVPDHVAYQAEYYSYLMNGLLTQMARIQLGHQIEEAHMRNRALIARWVLDHSDSSVEIIERNSINDCNIYHYVKINDYHHVQLLFGKLLGEIQRIKSEGDYEAAKYLVEAYGVKLDNTIHKEILNRYNRLNIAPFKGFINPWMKPVYDQENNLIDIKLDYTETYAHQMMRYSKESESDEQ